jgi:hypothetical protein
VHAKQDVARGIGLEGPALRLGDLLEVRADLGFVT